MVESLPFSCISICFYLLLVYSPSKSDAVPFTEYGVTQSDLELGASRAQATIPLATPFRFSGQSYSSVNVNFNGVLSFGNTRVVPQNPVAFPSSSSSAGPIMAPFWTQSQFSGSTGHVYYRADSTSRTLTNLQDEIAGVFRGTGITQPSLVLSQAIIVTWTDLQDQSEHSQTNSFQCVIAIGSSATYVLFKYADNGLKWAGQSPALVGFNAGDGVHSFVLPTSQTAEVLQITRTGNTASDGRWLFRVDQRSVTFPGAIVGFKETHNSFLESKKAEFCVSLSAGSISSQEVRFDITDRSIDTDNEDYTLAGFRPISSQDMSPENNQTVCRALIVEDDLKYENNERFLVNLKMKAPAIQAFKQLIAILPNSKTFTILDNDGVFVNYGDVVAIEENTEVALPVYLVLENSGEMLCSHSRYRTQRDVQVSYFTFDGTAQAIVDYIPLNGSLTIPAGSCEGSIALTLVNDQIYEEKKYFFYSLHSNNPNIVINSSRTSAQVLLTDGDAQSVVIGFSQTQYTVVEGHMVELCVEMFEGMIAQPVDLKMMKDRSDIEVNEAVDGQDFEHIMANVRFLPEMPLRQRMCVNVTTMEDNVYEGREVSYVFVQSESPVTLRPHRTRLNILDTDRVTVSMANRSFVYHEGNNRKLEVCANMTGLIERNLILITTPREGTAIFYDIQTGRDGDFSRDISNIVFEVEPGHVRRCFPNCVACTQVTIQNDAVLEEEFETFSIDLNHSDPSVNITDRSATITIVDNNSVMVSVDTFSLQSMSLRENQVLTPRVCVTRHGEADLTIAIKIAAKSRTATNHIDFEVGNLTVVIPKSRSNAGRICGTVTVTVLDDLVAEGDEIFTVFLEAQDKPSRVVIDSRGERNITIVDDDSVSVNFNQTSYNVTEREGSASLCLQMKGFSAVPQTVMLTPTPGSAEGGVDYQATPLFVSLPPSADELLAEAFSLLVPNRLALPLPYSPPFCANFSIINDDIVEMLQYKNFHITLTNSSPSVGVLPPTVAMVTIEDDDYVVVELEDPTITEVTEGSAALICARLSGRANFSIRAFLRPVGVAGSAQESMDFSERDYSLVFPALSVDRKCANVTTLQDEVVEEEEVFMVELQLEQSISRVARAPKHSTNISITDNDVVEVGFDKDEYSVLEGEGQVRICANLTGFLDRSIVVLFSTQADNALPPPVDGAIINTAAATEGSGQDYGPVLGWPLFVSASSDYSRRECVNISITNDSALENTEDFQVLLTSPNSFVQMTRPQSTVYILDDDSVRISLEHRRTSVLESARALEVCVALDGLTQQELQVTLATRQESATDGVDYSPLQDTLTFLPSASPLQRQCVNVSITDDDKFEEDEKFLMVLSVRGRVAVSIHIPVQEVTIRDNDHVTLALSMASPSSVEEREGAVRICANLTGATERNVSYSLHAVDMEAAAGLDYSTSFPTSLTFLPSDSTRQSQCYQVTIIDDELLENTEQFELELVAPVGVARLDTGYMTRATVSITDDDEVLVKFVRTEVEIDEDSPAHSANICVVMEGQIRRAVSVTVASHPGTARADDFVLVRRSLTFSPLSTNPSNMTICFDVHAVPDKLVEQREDFSLILNSRDIAVKLVNTVALVTITDEDVVCNKVSMDTSRGYMTWPTTFPEEKASIKCEQGMAERYCTKEGTWEKAVIDNCYVSTKELFRYLQKVTEFRKDNLRDLLFGLLQMLLENLEPTLRHMQTVDKVFSDFAEHVQNGTVDVDTEIFSIVLKVVDIVIAWPPQILNDYSSNVILSQEKITGGLFQPKNFSSYSKSLNRTAFLARKVPADELFGNGHVKYSFRNITGNVSLIKNAKGLDKLGAAIELPSSIQKSLQGDGNARLFLSYYSTGAMFPLEQDRIQKDGQRLEVSSVVAASLEGATVRDLTEDVFITFQLGHSNYSNVTCVSWDFSSSGGKGSWVEDGCELILTDGSTVVCSCNHLTNFACLVSITDRVDQGSREKGPVSIALSVLSVTGICISILSLILTIITLAVFNKLRKKETTVFRLQLCISMILMLVTFLTGITQVKVFTVCVISSALLHYFTLTSILWMAAEAILMFHKLVFVFHQVTTRFLVIVSLICWLLPIPAVVIPIGLNRQYVVSDSYCFISNATVFFAAFLGPIMAVILFNIVIFVIVVIVVLKHSCNSKRINSKSAKRKNACRTMSSVLGIMSLMGLTWVFGAFTISGTARVFEFLFVGFNSLQGFFIFLFFIAFAKETQDLWLQACGCKEKKRRTTWSSAVVSYSSRSQKVKRVTLDNKAERLKAMEEVNVDDRKQSNSWDISFIMSDNQFDVFLSADAAGQNQQTTGTKDEEQEEDVVKVPDTIIPAISDRGHTTTTQEVEVSPLHIPVCPLDAPESATSQDSSSIIRERDANRMTSPTAESLDSNQENAMEILSTADSGILMDNKKTTPSPTSTKPPSHHIHSASGIGYVSAESSLEHLPQREEDCYVKGKADSIEIAPSLIPRARPNDYSRLRVEKV